MHPNFFLLSAMPYSVSFLAGPKNGVRVVKKKKRTFECKAGILLQSHFPSLLFLQGFLGDDGGFTQDWPSCAMRCFSKLRLSGIQNTGTSSKMNVIVICNGRNSLTLHAASRVAFRKGPYEESKIVLGSSIKPGMKF